ncbi:MAG: hypothetical protein OXJ62_09390 [Spirochaetaceae bacterium]|nr:hypothetical protein [Spirochaetaceae bacterium]
MSDHHAEIRALHLQLTALAMRWAMSGTVDEDYARKLRFAAIRTNHRHYYDRVPIYRRLADQAEVARDADTAQIAAEMMSTDHIFKSYPQEYIDNKDYGAMNGWLRQVFDRPVEADVDGVMSIDQWLARLAQNGIHTVFSSGTSGHISFVARDAYTWSQLTGLGVSYIPLFQMRQGAARAWERTAARTAARMLGPDGFGEFFRRRGLRGFDGVFLSFSGGTQGTQVVGQTLARMVGRATFLFDLDLSATVVRALVRGPADERERQLSDAFLDATVRRRTDNFRRVLAALRDSTAARRRTLLFGAPFMIKEFCEWLVAEGEEVVLRAGSMLSHGGGWKSFEGDRIDEPAFLALIEQSLGVRPECVNEGYSMTEAQVVFPRCREGRFHVPPITETVIFDEALEPVTGDDVHGGFGFLDPYAACYPGFIITGDNVRRRVGGCPCGMDGVTISDIGRATGREVKGCGGIMAAMQG